MVLRALWRALAFSDAEAVATIPSRAGPPWWFNFCNECYLSSLPLVCARIAWSSTFSLPLIEFEDPILLPALKDEIFGFMCWYFAHPVEDSALLPLLVERDSERSGWPILEVVDLVLTLIFSFNFSLLPWSTGFLSAAFPTVLLKSVTETPWILGDGATKFSGGLLLAEDGAPVAADLSSLDIEVTLWFWVAAARSIWSTVA